MKTAAIDTPVRSRIWCILQLCLVFSVICWNAGYPFLGELYQLRSQLFLYQYVKGDGELVQRLLEPALLERQKARFASLPATEQLALQNGYRALREHYDSNWSTRLTAVPRILMLDLAPLLQVWLLLGGTLAIFVLVRRPGAVQAVWLLPLAAAAYAADNSFYAPVTAGRADASLYPSEDVLLREYLHEPLAASINDQQRQLSLGWQHYLVAEWSGQEPATEPLLRQQQVEAGEYRFTLARLHRLSQQPFTTPWRYRHSPLLLWALLGWSCLFAWRCHRLQIDAVTFNVVNLLKKPRLSPVDDVQCP